MNVIEVSRKSKMNPKRNRIECHDLRFVFFEKKEEEFQLELTIPLNLKNQCLPFWESPSSMNAIWNMLTK